MGAVYRALDERLNRPVAVKLLKETLSTDAVTVRRFAEEARAAAAIADPHVVAVWDQGLDESDGTPLAFLVMELVDGATLRDLIKRRSPMTVREMLRVAVPLSRGLAAAHRSGLVHRDIKPENVLVSPRGSVKVTDFGLTRQVQAESSTMTLVGSANYIAPELVKREPAGTAADTYSVGIVLYEMLTGVPPFRGATPYAVSMAHVNDPMPDVGRRFPGLDPEIAEIIAWCCDKDPDNRPQHAEDLLGELLHISQDLGAEALDLRPPGYREDARDLFSVLSTDSHTAAVDLPEMPRPPERGAPGGAAGSNAAGRGGAVPEEDDAGTSPVTGPTVAVSPEGAVGAAPLPGGPLPAAEDPETPEEEPGSRTPYQAEDERPTESVTAARGLDDATRAFSPGRTAAAREQPGPRAASAQAPRDPAVPLHVLGGGGQHRGWVWLLVFVLAACTAGYLGWLLGVEILSQQVGQAGTAVGSLGAAASPGGG